MNISNEQLRLIELQREYYQSLVKIFNVMCLVQDSIAQSQILCAKINSVMEKSPRWDTIADLENELK